MAETTATQAAALRVLRGGELYTFEELKQQVRATAGMRLTYSVFHRLVKDGRVRRVPPESPQGLNRFCLNG